MSDANPYEGIADNFARGGQQAMSFASTMMELEAKKQAAEIQRAQLAETQRQHKIQQGQWMWDKVEKLINEPNGPTKNLMIKYFRKGAVDMGFEDPEMLSEMVKDPATIAELALASQQLNDPDITDEERKNIFEKLAKGITSKDFNERLKENTAFLAEVIKMRQTEKEKRKTDKAKAELEKDDKVDTFVANERERLRSSPEFKEYTTTSLLIQDFEKAIKKSGPYRDLDAMVSFMKLLDPNSVVRESEGQLFINTGSKFEGVANYLQKLWNGKTLQPAQRAELMQIARGRLTQQMARANALLDPVVEQATAKGAPDPSMVNPVRKLYERDKAYLEEAAKKEGKGDGGEGGTGQASRFGRETQLSPDQKYGAKKVGQLKAFKARGLSREQTEQALGFQLPDDLANFVWSK